MIDLTHPDEVRRLQDSLRVAFDTPQGEELMELLEQICGWYNFHESDTNKVLINTGKRQVLATIKTLLTTSPEQVAQLAEMEQ